MHYVCGKVWECPSDSRLLNLACPAPAGPNADADTRHGSFPNAIICRFEASLLRFICRFCSCGSGLCSTG